MSMILSFENVKQTQYEFELLLYEFIQKGAVLETSVLVTFKRVSFSAQNHILGRANYDASLYISSSLYSVFRKF